MKDGSIYTLKYLVVLSLLFDLLQPSKMYVTRYLRVEYKPICSVFRGRVRYYQLYIQYSKTE